MGLYLSYSKNINSRTTKAVFFFWDTKLVLKSYKGKEELLSNTNPKSIETYTLINGCALNRNFDNYEILLDDSLDEQDLKNLLNYLSNYLLDKEISIGLLTNNPRFIDNNFELFDGYGVTIPKTIHFKSNMNVGVMKCCYIKVDAPSGAPIAPKAKRKSTPIPKPKTIKLKESFHDQLLKLIIESDKDNAEIYGDGGITRQVFSKIMCTPTLIPKKETVICLCIGLELPLQPSLQLLNAAGYTLSESIMLDSIVMKYLNDEIYDLDFINSELNEYNCPLLGWHPRED